MTRLEKLKAIERIIDAFLKPEPDEGWPEGMTSSSDVLRMIQEVINDDHAAEVDRLRELLECAQGDRDTWERMYYENRDEKREAAIYGAVIARYGIHLNEAVARRAHEAAERVLTAWRAAQKGGSDG